MFRKITLQTEYSPLYFLASLGNGGLTVTFFLYLMFLLPHPKTPIPTYETWSAAILSGSPLVSGLIMLALVGVIYFALQHVRLLVWNITQYNQFKETETCIALRSGNGAVQLMAIPLTYAMTINVGFILGALFVPGLWRVVEWLFPFALLGFGGVGFYGFVIFLSYFKRLIGEGHKDWSTNNNLSQLLAIFAFSMVAVGFAAPAAMSHTTPTAVIAMIGSIFFLSVVAVLGSMKLLFGLRDILENGISLEGSPSLWIIIPILTVSGIALVRLGHGFDHVFHLSRAPGDSFVFIVVFFSIQLLFGIIGYSVMKNNGYFDKFVAGEAKSAGAYALICPGVALMVFGMFFVHVALVKNALIVALSWPHLLLLLPLIYLQFKTIHVMGRLNRKHLSL